MGYYRPYNVGNNQDVEMTLTVLLSLSIDKTLEKPKSGTLKSPPKGFDTTIISKTYYNVVSIKLY